ncbi:MAG: hypothetical protein GY913_19880 [Proteobacteria bacterium]|nr:hypothetical protein [Pseudomonadota bacterium]MCP4919169.1 hypothetical protein [Pseudomonadota bacterium]
MRLVSAALALVLGVLLLLAAAYAEGVVQMLVGLGAPIEDSPMAAFVTLGVTASLGITCTVMSAVRFYQGVTDRSALYEPYIDPLSRLAAESGCRIELHPRDGVGYASNAEGVRMEVLVQPADHGFVSLWLEAPARQRLLFVPIHAEGAQSDDADWRVVGRRGGWVLRAALPSVARPMLADGPLVDDVNRVMEAPEVMAVRHDERGIEVMAELVSPDRLHAMMRDCLTLARRLRRINA